MVSLTPTDAKVVSVSTPQTIDLKKRKFESPPVETRSLQLKLQKGLIPQLRVNKPAVEITQKLTIEFVDFLEEFNIKRKNITKDSRFRVDLSGNI